MMMLVDQVLAAGAVLGLGFAAFGCSTTTTTAIRPDQLPILTSAAAGAVLRPQEVIGASGRMVRVDETLEEVEITLWPGPGGVKTYNAPVASEIRGPMLFVRDEERADSFPLSWTQGVKVTYADKDARLVGGVWLNILAGLFLAGGTAVVIGGVVSDANHNSDLQFGYIFALAVGLPLLLTGSGMLVPGILMTRSGAHKPKYPPRPLSRAMAGPGGFRVSF